MKTIKELLIIFGIGSIVTSVWILLEKLMLKEVTPNQVDSIIALILIYSLYGNLKWWESIKEKQPSNIRDLKR